MPPKVIVLLEGHRNGVTAFDWSISNDLIVSSSLDATIRLWRVCTDVEPVCLRVVDDQQRAEVLCCNFIPANNNLIVAGNSQGLIQILNVSTGIYTRGGSCKIGGKVSPCLEKKSDVQKNQARLNCCVTFLDSFPGVRGQRWFSNLGGK